MMELCADSLLETHKGKGPGSQHDFRTIKDYLECQDTYNIAERASGHNREVLMEVVVDCPIHQTQTTYTEARRPSRHEKTILNTSDTNKHRSKKTPRTSETSRTYPTERFNGVPFYLVVL